mmetsp:Transcript_103639/g.334034  ORF Transcript_103639/g.334034 Transcript_103639/m.334034 type:complete len:308 (+) Transcript_103639:83-1006(+)
MRFAAPPRGDLHSGQRPFKSMEARAQASWKRWPHCVKTRSFPDASSRHTLHSTELPVGSKDFKVDSKNAAAVSKILRLRSKWPNEMLKLLFSSAALASNACNCPFVSAMRRTFSTFSVCCFCRAWSTAVFESTQASSAAKWEQSCTHLSVCSPWRCASDMYRARSRPVKETSTTCSSSGTVATSQLLDRAKWSRKRCASEAESGGKKIWRTSAMRMMSAGRSILGVAVRPQRLGARMSRIELKAKHSFPATRCFRLVNSWNSSKQILRKQNISSAGPHITAAKSGSFSSCSCRAHPTASNRKIRPAV